MLRGGNRPSMQSLDESILSVCENEPFNNQSPFKKSRHMKRVTSLIEHLSGGDPGSFRNYALHRSKFFSPTVKQEKKGVYTFNIWNFFVFM
jgi:hypothetical protein